MTLNSIKIFTQNAVNPQVAKYSRQAYSEALAKFPRQKSVVGTMQCKVSEAKQVEIMCTTLVLDSISPGDRGK